MKSDHGKKPRSTGVGESKNFGNPQAPENSYLEKLHMGGKLIGENFTAAQIAMLRFEFTDEGIAERNAGKVESAARVTCDPFAKEVQHRDDDQNTVGMEPWEAYSPMKELEAKYMQPGMRARYLSDRTVQRSGMRGWVPVKDERGNLVKLGNMQLAAMPEAKAKKRNQYFADLSANNIQRETEAQQEKQEQIAREGGPLAPTSNATVIGRFGVGTGSEEGDQTYDGNPTATIGLQTRRGDQRI
jgi:hypothetical protein